MQVKKKHTKFMYFRGKLHPFGVTKHPPAVSNRESKKTLSLYYFYFSSTNLFLALICSSLSLSLSNRKTKLSRVPCHGKPLTLASISGDSVADPIKMIADELLSIEPQELQFPCTNRLVKKLYFFPFL